MECAQVEREEIVEQYLTGQLTPEAQQEFEEHYFACPRCFDRVQTLRAAQAELSANESAIRAAVAAPQPVPRRWVWAAGLAAAAVIAAIVWLRPSPPTLPVTTTPAPPAKTAPPSPAGPSLAELARFDPPAFAPAVLRGAQDEATRKFRDAMQHYARGDYRSAIPGLREAVRLNPTDPGARFFLGISDLLAGQTDEGIAALQQTLALGDTPYLEEGHFYLAKAYLSKRDLTSAQGELKKTIDLQGELKSKAGELLQQVESLRTIGR